MNEPLIALRENEHGHPLRHFVDGDAPRPGGAARHGGGGTGSPTRDLMQRVLSRAAELGYAAAALTKAGLKLARRR